MSKLTNKQGLFVKEYLVDLNATQAAIRAGYSEKTAREIGKENLTKPLISEAIEKAMKKRSEKVDVNAEFVIKKLLEIMERCMQGVPVRQKNSDGEMEETGEWKFDAPSAIKALELMGKHQAMFRDVKIVNNLANLSEAELETELVSVQGRIRELIEPRPTAH